MTLAEYQDFYDRCVVRLGGSNFVRVALAVAFGKQLRAQVVEHLGYPAASGLFSGEYLLADSMDIRDAHGAIWRILSAKRPIVAQSEPVHNGRIVLTADDDLRFATDEVSILLAHAWRNPGYSSKARGTVERWSASIIRDNAEPYFLHAGGKGVSVGSVTAASSAGAVRVLRRWAEENFMAPLTNVAQEAA